MPSLLQISVDGLLRLERVESARVEFKSGWDERTRSAILRTICAYANDLQNLDGGYIVIGVKEQTAIDEKGRVHENGLAELPPVGIPPEQIDEIQKWIRGKCKGLIFPEYQPIISPEVYQDKHIVVIWAPASDAPPHETVEWVAEDFPRKEDKPLRHPYVRQGSETVIAKGQTLTDLREKSRRTPYDDQRRLDASVDDVRFILVREFLSEVGSGLLSERDELQIYRNLRLITRVNGHEVPRNIALLFFTSEPERFFPTARIELVQFRDPEGGDTIEERVFRGPLHSQLRDCLRTLQNLLSEEIRKHPDRAEASGIVSYPYNAIEEALVNAVYHRSYEYTEQSGPVKVHLYPDRLQIISYPGPVAGLLPEHFQQGRERPPVAARNRRVGELLKDLRLAEARYTGVPKVFRAMQKNGSPTPKFHFGEDRSYFSVTLPAHPEYVALGALRDAAHLEAIGQAEAARERLSSTFAQVPQSGALAARLIESAGRMRDYAMAEVFFAKHEKAYGPASVTVLRAMINACFDSGMNELAKKFLDRLPTTESPEETVEKAILLRRVRHEQEAHRLFEGVRDSVMKDARALLEFAQCKLRLAHSMARSGRHSDRHRDDAVLRLRRDAHDLLRRVLQLNTTPLRLAWAWLELARVERLLNSSRSEAEHALAEAERLGSIDSKLRDQIANERQALATLRGPQRR